MSKHNNIYNILGKLSALESKPAPQKSILGELTEAPKMKDLATRLNERYLAEKDMGKHNNATTGFKALAKKAGGGEKGERIAGAQFQKMKKAGQLEEEPMDARAAAAAKRAEWARAAQELTKKPDPEYAAMHAKRAKELDDLEAQRTAAAKKPWTPKPTDLDADHDRLATGTMEEQITDEDMLSPKQKKIAGLRPPPGKIDANDLAALRAGKSKEKEGNEFSGELAKAKAQHKDEFEVDGKTYPVKENGLQRYTGIKKYGKKGFEALQAAGRDGASEEEKGRIKDRYIKNEDSVDPANHGEYDREGEMAAQDLETAEDAAEELRSILDADENLPEWVQAKITKAVDYLDTARDYMQSKDEEVQEGEYQDKVDKSKIPAFQRKAKGGDDWKVDLDDLDDEASKSPTSAAGLEKAKQRMRDQGMMEGFPTVADAKARAEKEKGTGKFDVQKTSTGTRYTRKPETFADADSDDAETNAGDAPKKKGRPKKNHGPERTTAKAWKHKGSRVSETYKPVKLDTFVEDTLTEMDSLLLNEKAKSKAQQKFMGMVHAAQKGEKPASKEVGKVAKDMSKKDAKDFASTKHKGLPEKVSESIAYESAEPGLNAICHRYGKECKDFMTTGHMHDDLFHALYDHYFDDMPYGVKKARDGDPYEWVSDRFYADMGGDHHDAGPDALSTIPPNIKLNKDHELDELAALAGLGRKSVGESSCNMTMEGEMCPVHGFAECWSGGMMESKESPKANKDYDGDGEVESEKDEVIGSRRKAAGLDESKCPDCGMDPCDCDHEKEKVDECGMPGAMSPMGSMQPEAESGMSISGSMDTKTGRKTLTVNADGEAAEELAQMLKMAGIIGGHEAEAPVAQAVPKIVAIGHQHGDMMGEAYANEPDPEYASTEEILDQGGDLNRKKKQFADKPKSGDNPIATKESLQLEARLSKLYDSIKIRK